VKSRIKKTDKTKPVYIYGKHALREALTQRPLSVQKIFLSPQFDDEQLLQVITKSRISVFTLKTKELENEVGSETSHQGVIALIDPGQLMVPFASFIESLDMRTNPGLVVFDEVHDPQNVGSVIRSAAAFGISAILFPEHNQAQITGSVVKVSAGMAFRIPLVSIGNVNQTVRTLKEKGFWVYGLDMNGTPVIEETFEKPSVFILGNEARGIREKTLELCDIPLSIPMHPRTESLNAATAAAIVMYQWSAHHPEALQ
jgi:23S rRNA (guanosine2251-2'-O)-methyltransferase